MYLTQERGGELRVSDRPSEHPVNELILRLLDLIVGIIAIIVFAPLLIGLAIAIYASDPGPLIFAQPRIGRNGREFRCLKFRTMVVDATDRLEQLLANDPAARAEWARDHKLRNDPRITPLGRFLRKSSLDELPQFFNLINGTMSIVGPRPIVNAEVVRYGRRFADYCRVRPGITGLWQVSGRSDTTYRRRVALDVAYSKHRSLGLNIKIMMMTVPAVLAAKGSR
ncbi:lipopolysaccharide/colanic/teichoic acid biosynthesis glycosyltransferase [Sphingomonas melonis]|jgi:exopolysaccharide production protein ExoY|uniref:Lipopolysaccharide/colanic/teichoic acid biosynthesis glycosyltransferase n=1 Tax=Sphingomonas melonis TaxID=152682 RepID=A0A7Y9FR84_9SPHN|nr:lipopolysaccharide/colanic/teichoic acid biosynthesis glycosyltransferase [Sphingomonas melonis]